MIVPETIVDWRLSESVERPFIWDGKIHQDAMIEAFVVEVSNSRVHFVITHYDPAHDFDFSESGGYSSDRYQTVGRHQAWSSQFPKDYRELLCTADAAYKTGVPETSLTDSVPLSSDTPELVAGDFIHIHQSLLWEEPSENGSKSGLTVFDICKLPKPNELPEAFFERAARLRPRIAKQLVRTMAKKEALRMNQQNRITPNEPLQPFKDPDSTLTPIEWNGIKSHIYRSRNVFGNGPVKDHFVDITATPAGDYYTELGGTENFTSTGRHLFTPNVMPFGEGSEDDPLHVVRVAVYSTTVFNPAVGEQRAYITIDGIKYELLKNAGESSYYFERPGHDVIYEGVREEGVEYDTYQITSEQSEALRQRHIIEKNIVGAVVNQAFADFEADGVRPDLATLERQAEEKVTALRAESSKVNKAIAGILGTEPDVKLSSGAHLLVPKSMLDSIEITLPGTDL